MKLYISKSARAQIKGGGTVFLTLLLLVCLISFSRPQGLYTSLKTVEISPTIVLDAGHGGFDGGASSSSGALEKDINLSIALKTRDVLTLFGFDVVMTRDDDTALANTKKEDMYSRLDIVKNNPNSVFISIHQNHFSEGKYSGAQMFYGANNSEDARALALILQNNFKENLNPQNTRQVKSADKSLFLFKKAPQPSVLIECGFLSNFSEAQLLQNEKYQTKIALTIAQSVTEYYIDKDVERNIKNGSTEV